MYVFVSKFLVISTQHYSKNQNMEVSEHHVVPMPTSTSQETIEAVQAEAPIKAAQFPERFTSHSLFKLDLPTDITSMLAEFVGTLFFIFLSLGTVQTALTLDQDVNAAQLSPLAVLIIATGFGLAVTVSIAMVGNISGAHLNPAVSIALAASGLMPLPKMIMYIIAQCCGSITGAAFVQVITPGPLLGYNAISPSVTTQNALLAGIL
jgi:hypothetical protein